MNYRKIFKQGKSLGLTIPSEIAHALYINRGDYLGIVVLNNKEILLFIPQPGEIEHLKNEPIRYD